MQSILKALNLFFSFLENSNIVDCQPPYPVKLPNIPVPVSLPQPIPPSTYKLAITEGFERGCITIAVTTALKANPRTSMVAGVTAASFEFLRHFFNQLFWLFIFFSGLGKNNIADCLLPYPIKYTISGNCFYITS